MNLNQKPELDAYYQAERVERARKVLEAARASQDFSPGTMAVHLGALEWHLGETLALIADLSASQAAAVSPPADRLTALTELAGPPSAPGVTLTARELGTVLAALGDAAEYRRELGLDSCPECQAYAAACDDCHGDLAAAFDYDDLARRLGSGE